MKTTQLFLLCGCLLTAIQLTAQVEFNPAGTSTNASAIFELTATNKGMLVPRMTFGQRLALPSPATGLLVYDTDNKSFFYYDGTNWKNMAAPPSLFDTDGDTGIRAEFNADDDLLRFYAAGIQSMILVKNANNIPRLELINSNLNTYVGEDAGLDNTTGERNTGFGYHALFSTTSGSRNIGIGWNAVANNQTGNSNVGIGYWSLRNNIASNIVAVGDSSLMNNSIGTANTAIGSKALLANNSGDQNTALGFRALYGNTNGEANTASGYLALSNNTTGDSNTGVGVSAVLSNVTGNQNTGLGRSAYFTAAGLNNTTAVGYASGGQSNVSNRIEIGNTSVTAIAGQVNWSTYSDARIKTQVQENVPGLAFIAKLRPVTYHFDIHKQNAMTLRGKEESADYPEKYDIEQKQFTGFIAQEVEAAAQAVGYDFSGVEQAADEVGLYSVRYAEFVVPLVKAVQEQQAVIEDTKSRMQNLEAENIALKAEVEALKSVKAQLEKITAALAGAGIAVEK